MSLITYEITAWGGPHDGKTVTVSRDVIESGMLRILKPCEPVVDPVSEVGPPMAATQDVLQYPIYQLLLPEKGLAKRVVKFPEYWPEGGG